MILLWLLACDPPATPVAPQLPAAAQEATFGTLRELGSWRMTAEVRRTIDGAAPSVELFEVRWRDDDHWSWIQTRDGVARSEVVVWDAVAWARNAQGSLERKGDAESWRVQLATVWDPWRWGLEGLADAVVLSAGPVELLEGRRAVRYAVSAAEREGRRGWQLRAARGDVWIDEATALRIRASVAVEAVAGDTQKKVELLFAIDGIGLDPDISAPARDTR